MLWAVVRKDRIELLENAQLPDGTRVLVVLPDGNMQLRENPYYSALDNIWCNPEDDVYARILQK